MSSFFSGSCVSSASVSSGRQLPSQFKSCWAAKVLRYSRLVGTSVVPDNRLCLSIVYMYKSLSNANAIKVH